MRRPSREVAHRQADAADLERFGQQRHAALAEDHLGGAPADVDDQARRVGGLQARHAGVDEPRFLAPGDHLDRVAQRRPVRAAGRHCGCAPRAASASPPRAPGAARSRPVAAAKRPGSPGRAAPRLRSAGRRRRARRPGARFPSGSRCGGSGRAAVGRSRAGSCSSPCRPRPADRAEEWALGCACPIVPRPQHRPTRPRVDAPPYNAAP